MFTHPVFVSSPLRVSRPRPWRSGAIAPSITLASTLSTLAFSALVLGITAPSARAESAQDTVWGPKTTDVFSGQNSTGSFLDLMRQISNPGLDPATFRSQSQQNVQDAAEAFRQRQRQQLGQPVLPGIPDGAELQPTPPTPPVTPQ